MGLCAATYERTCDISEILVSPTTTPSPSPTPHSDLSTHTPLLDVVIGAFSSPTEETQAAFSYALGSVSAGNLQLYLPVILQEIEAKPRRQYLLLHSLKEVREGRVEHGGSEGRGGREGEGRISAV